MQLLGFRHFRSVHLERYFTPCLKRERHQSSFQALAKSISGLAKTVRVQGMASLGAWLDCSGQEGTCGTSSDCNRKFFQSKYPIRQMLSMNCHYDTLCKNGKIKNQMTCDRSRLYNANLQTKITLLLPMTTFQPTLDLRTRITNAVESTADALLTSTIIRTVGRVVARFSRFGGRMVIGITPSPQHNTHQ